MRPLCLPCRNGIWCGFGAALQRSCLGVKSEKLRVNNLSLHLWRWPCTRRIYLTLRSSLFRSWPLIGKRDLNFSLFTLRSSLIWVQSYNILIAVHECLVNFFQKFFFERHILLQCCSVAVLAKHFPYPKILLYLYINIEFNFDFYIIYFGTATLQHCNRYMRNLLLLSVLMLLSLVAVIVKAPQMW